MSFRFFRMYLKVPVVLLALIEAALFIFAPYQAAALRFGSAVAENVTPTGQLWPTAVLFSAVTVLSLFAMGLYTTRQRSTRTGMVLRIVAGVLNAAALSALLYYLVPNLEIGRGMLGLTAAVAIAGSMIARMLFDHIVDQDLFKRRVLVYGAGRRAASLLELRRRSDQRGFRIVGFIRTEGDDTGTPVERTLPRPDDLYSWVTKNPIDEIVVAMDDRRRGFPMHEFLECRLAGIDIIELPSFLERETGKVRLDVLNPSWIIFGEGFRASQVERWLERGFDLVAGSVLLMLALPIMFATAIAIMFEDGWKAPVLYRQRRVGQHGHVFDVLKFRSMSVDAERTNLSRSR